MQDIRQSVGVSAGQQGKDDFEAKGTVKPLHSGLEGNEFHREKYLSGREEE
jgi:hypothetical protein